jgi:hypothetical protein
MATLLERRNYVIRFDPWRRNEAGQVVLVECHEERGRYYASVHTLNASPVGVGESVDAAYEAWAKRWSAVQATGAATYAAGQVKKQIVGRLAVHGWLKDRTVDAFSKTFRTAVAPKSASLWLRFAGDRESWWLTHGDFTSAGENVLATASVFLSSRATAEEVSESIDNLVEELENRIAQAWSVRLLG